MTEHFDDRKALASAWFRQLRDDILLHCFEFLSMLPGALAMIHSESPLLARGAMHLGEASARLGHPGKRETVSGAILVL